MSEAGREQRAAAGPARPGTPTGVSRPEPATAEPAAPARRGSRTSGCGPWPTWTTAQAVRRPGRAGPRPRPRRGQPGSGCRWSTTSTARWSTPRPIRRAIVEGIQAVREQALDVLARLGFARRDDTGATFDPARHEAVAATARPGAPPGTVVRGRAAGLRRRRPPAAARAGRGGRRTDGAGLMADRRDFYEILGVPRTPARTTSSAPTASWPASTIPTSTRIREPRTGSRRSPRRYDVLSDPQTRRRYDAFGPDFRQVPEDVDPETWRRARAGAAGGGRRRGGPGRARRVRLRPGDDIDLDRPRAASSAGGSAAGRGRGWGPIPGADQEAEIELTVEEAYQGGRRSVTLSSDGTRRTFDVTIPAGVTDGQRIRLAGQGGRGSDGARNGDLYLIVRIAPAPALPPRRA